MNLRINTANVQIYRYRKEVEENKCKLDAMLPDDERYNQAKQVLEESKTMVVNTGERLRIATRDLESKLSAFGEDENDKAEAARWIQESRTISS